MNPANDEHRDPVEVIRHAREYIKRTRGAERLRMSLAGQILDQAEMKSAGCIDYLIGEKARAKGIHCCCDFHEAEWKVQHAATQTARPAARDGKAKASGETQWE